MKLKTIRPNYVSQFPASFEEGILYISEEFETAGHLCCCGCGEKVITPLNPVKWQIRKDGDKVSLSPSIGNWNYACQSHYWISQNQVVEAKKFDPKTIRAVQRRDRRDMTRYIERTNAAAAAAKKHKPSFASKVNEWLRRLLGS
ncbi:DUF6527 family protein [Cupriavidus neocaledonicus]|nr:DUF6527 family protein [Cupriavidus neocaledonicus]